MPKFTDDLFDHLTPPDFVEWTLDVSYPKGNPDRIVLQMKWAGQGSDYFKEAKKLALKPLTDPVDDMERDLRLFAKLGVAGWLNVGDNEPFNAKDCGDLLAHVLRARGKQGIVEFQRMLGAAATPEVFRKPAPPSVDDLGKE